MDEHQIRFGIYPQMAVNGMRSASEIDLKNCKEIARILEHAYVTADKIAEEILDHINSRI